MPLFLDVDVGETILIGGSRVTLQKKSGARARIRIDSDDEVTLDRGVHAEAAKPPEAPAKPEPVPAGDSSPRPLLSRPAPA